MRPAPTSVDLSLLLALARNAKSLHARIREYLADRNHAEVADDGSMRWILVPTILLFTACGSDAPGTTYFDRSIAPILEASCTGATSGCHQDTGEGEALGNLDLSSFEAVMTRQDVLVRHGSYTEPLLLIKATSSNGMSVLFNGEALPLENFHGGGAILTPDSESYITLKQWLDNGATENGLPPIAEQEAASGECNERLPDDIDFQSVDATSVAFGEFEEIEDYLVNSCGSAGCHGTRGADYYLTCGSSEEQSKANFYMTQAFVASSADDSELLTRPLASRGGGNYHSGGEFFETRTDSDYVLLRDWAQQSGPLELGELSPAREFFDDRVMPVLLQRGCAFQACHSPIVPHKLRLRAGSDGFFSPIARQKNYEKAKKGFMALESPDSRASRLVAKNLLASHRGITHRAGAILETPGQSADPADCPAVYDPATSSALCTVSEWLRLERAEVAPEFLSDMSPGATLPLIYVERPADSQRFVDFANYRPGADLLRSDVTLGPDLALGAVSPPVSLLDSCPGVGATRDATDVRGPEVSFDGNRVLFALQTTAGGGLDIYEVGIDGAGCQRLTSDGGVKQNGLTIHNLDPIYVVDEDKVEWIVYASSRGGASGPTRTPKHLLTGLDIWRQPVMGGSAEQMTFLRGVEAQPSLMRNGQLTMVKEKASNDFYQVSGRRINWDLSDYHPLLANREVNYEGRGGYLPGAEPEDASLRESIGFGQATEIRQALNGNFLAVFSDRDSYGEGGALGVFNRSIGPTEIGRSDPSFVQTLAILPGATGKAGSGTGAYRSPFPLADGNAIASFAPNVDVSQSQLVDYDLFFVNLQTGDRTPLVVGPGSQVEAILAYSRPPPKPLRLPQTGEGLASDSIAQVHFPDLPLLATLLDSNNRRGRAPESLRAATEVRFFTQDSPPSECTSPTDPACSGSLAGPEAVYESRRELGVAPIEADGSVYALVPAAQALFFELVDNEGRVLFRLREEFQFGPKEVIGIGVPATSFNTMCAGCHGSISGRELDVAVEPDALSGASSTVARKLAPVSM